MSKPRKIKISIPKPCNQDWDKMTAKEQGRFCEQCSKTVVDFSNFTDKELIDYLSNVSGKTCGRLNSTQVDRLIIASEPGNTPFFHKVLFGTALAAGVTGVANAQSSQSPTTNTATNSKIVGHVNISQERKINQSDTSDYFKGKVTDLATKEKLQQVSVSLQLNGIELESTTTDTAGFFRLPVLTEYKGKKLSIFFSAIGYNSLEKQITLRKNGVTSFSMVESKEKFIMGDIGAPLQEIKKDSIKKTH